MPTDDIDLRGARILVVDDMPANLDVLCELLETEGYKVSLAPNGRIALKIAGQEEARPGLILLDVMMPGIDGFEVCRRLKADERTAEIPVVFITAEDVTESVVKGFQVGGVDYISKPFRDEEVLVRVRNALLTKYLFEQNRAYQEKMEQELQTAHNMQMGLMPGEQARLDGFDIAGRCIPAEKVGGDFFQYHELAQGGLAISMTDVTGHAMEAAIPAVLFNGMLETQMEVGHSLGDLFAKLNRSVNRILDSRTLVCFEMAQIDPASRCMRLANAGCPYPFYFCAVRGDVVELEANAYPLGASAETAHAVVEHPLGAGDRVVFCSDGLLEAADADGRLFGFERASRVIRQGCSEGAGAEELVERIVAEARDFAGESPQEDDQTVVVVEVKG